MHCDFAISIQKFRFKFIHVIAIFFCCFIKLMIYRKILKILIFSVQLNIIQMIILCYRAII